MHEAAFEKIGHRREPNVRVRTDIGALERLEFLGTEMIEEQERPHGLALGGGKQAAHLEVAHRAQPRLQDQDVRHYLSSLYLSIRAIAPRDGPIRDGQLANAFARRR